MFQHRQGFGLENTLILFPDVVQRIIKSSYRLRCQQSLIVFNLVAKSLGDALNEQHIGQVHHIESQFFLDTAIVVEPCLIVQCLRTQHLNLALFQCPPTVSHQLFAVGEFQNRELFALGINLLQQQERRVSIHTHNRVRDAYHLQIGLFPTMMPHAHPIDFFTQMRNFSRIVARKQVANRLQFSQSPLEVVLSDEYLPNIQLAETPVTPEKQQQKQEQSHTDRHQPPTRNITVMHINPHGSGFMSRLNMKHSQFATQEKRRVVGNKCLPMKPHIIIEIAYEGQPVALFLIFPKPQFGQTVDQVVAHSDDKVFTLGIAHGSGIAHDERVARQDNHLRGIAIGERHTANVAPCNRTFHPSETMVSAIIDAMVERGEIKVVVVALRIKTRDIFVAECLNGVGFPAFGINLHQSVLHSEIQFQAVVGSRHAQCRYLCLRLIEKLLPCQQQVAHETPREVNLLQFPSAVDKVENAVVHLCSHNGRLSQEIKNLVGFVAAFELHKDFIACTEVIGIDVSGGCCCHNRGVVSDHPLMFGHLPDSILGCQSHVTRTVVDDENIVAERWNFSAERYGDKRFQVAREHSAVVIQKIMGVAHMTEQVGMEIEFNLAELLSMAVFDIEAGASQHTLPALDHGKIADAFTAMRHLRTKRVHIDGQQSVLCCHSQFFFALRADCLCHKRVAIVKAFHAAIGINRLQTAGVVQAVEYEDALTRGSKQPFATNHNVVNRIVLSLARDMKGFQPASLTFVTDLPLCKSGIALSHPTKALSRSIPFGEHFIDAVVAELNQFVIVVVHPIGITEFGAHPHGSIALCRN